MQSVSQSYGLWDKRKKKNKEKGGRGVSRTELTSSGEERRGRQNVQQPFLSLSLSFASHGSTSLSLSLLSLSSLSAVWDGTNKEIALGDRSPSRRTRTAGRPRNYGGGGGGTGS